MGDYVTLTCPTCGASLSAVAGAQSLVCGFCGNAHILRADAELVADARDPAEVARMERLHGEIAELERQIHALAVTILQREYRQAAGALVSLGKLTLRELKALLATEDPAEPARLIAALSVDELALYVEQYQGSPLIMTRKRRAGVEDVARLLALRLQVEARSRRWTIDHGRWRIADWGACSPERGRSWGASLGAPAPPSHAG